MAGNLGSFFALRHHVAFERTLALELKTERMRVARLASDRPQANANVIAVAYGVSGL